MKQSTGVIGTSSTSDPGAHRRDLPAHGVREFGVVSSPDVQAQVRPPEQPRHVANLDAPLVALRVDNVDTARRHHDVVDVAACMGHAPVVQEDHILAIDLSERGGKLALTH
jgi:hypothetical protein